MTQAFEELELEVESCSDIFSALERVTGQSFDIILADLDQGPEAGFLLKTAHELKLNRSAFAFAVASGTAYAEPEEFGVELVLAKPIIPDQVKYALLSCDSFLAGMRSWSVRGDSATKQEAPAVVLAKESRQARPQVQPAPRKLRVRPSEPSTTTNQGWVKKPEPPSVAPATPSPEPVRSPMPAPVPPSPSRSTAVQSKTRVSQSKVLWSTTLGVSFLALAYGVSRPPSLNFFATTIGEGRKALAQVYDRTLEIAGNASHGPKETKPADVEVVSAAAAFPSVGVRAAASSTPRMIPAHHSPTPEQAPPRGPETLQAKADLEPEPLPVAARRVQIPDSIRLQQPEPDSVRTVAARLPSLLGQLEPIRLSEDVAEQLLSQKVQPNYPEQALKAGLQGAVVLQAWIGTDGSIRELKLVHGSLLLGQAAYKAVKQWRYKPYLLDGKAVEAQTYVTVNFRLPQQSLLMPAAH